MTYERNYVSRFRCMLPFFYFYQQYAITQMLPSQRFEGRRREGEREMTAVAGFYRRILPSPPAIEFASLEGKQLFSEAFQEGNAEGFFILISYYQTQSEPAYCGLSTLSMVLNALGIDPGRKWKGPWRWFDDSMLDCCEPLEKIKANGISFGKVACLANCNGAKVEAFRANESSIHHFRKSVISCTSSGDCHVIVSYHRKYLNQTGGGHFSPIGAYHAERDMVLILDVARFKYPPHWVPLSLLWTAMNTVDEATGQHRGFMLVTRLERAPSILFTMSCRYESWSATAEYLAKEVSQLLSTKEIRDIQELLAVLFTSAPSDLRDFINWVVEVQRQDDRSESEVIGEEEKERLSIKAELLEQVRKTLLYSHIAKWLATESCCKYVTSSATKDSFGEVAATVCCEGAHFLFGKFVPSNGSCGKTTDVRLSKDGGDTQLTLVTESDGQDANVLVPCSQENKEHLCGCSANPSTGRHPSNEDVLTVLVLALPPNTWSGIRDKKLREEICGIVSVEKLPSLLQEEVLHLRRQLHLLSSECRIFLSST